MGAETAMLSGLLAGLGLVAVWLFARNRGMRAPAPGETAPDFALADADELFGDSVEQTVTWNGRDDVSSLSGRPIRLRFVLRDADLFSYRFSDR